MLHPTPRARARTQDWRAEAIGSPLIIIGLPRTGTSFLLELLSVDEESWRTLRNFEAHWMLEPRGDAERRAQRAQVAFGQLYNERTGGSHYEEVDGPTEDATAMLKGLCGTYCRLPMYVGPEGLADGDDGPYGLAGDAWTGSFDREFLRSDARRAADFAFFSAQLRLLQAAGRGGGEPAGARRPRWCLKDPIHLANLQPLLAAFPDARLVFLHRHPAFSVASGAALVESINGAVHLGLRGEAQSRQWAASLMHQYAGMANAAVRAREGIPGARVCDLYYDDFVADPLAAVARVYEFAGERLSDAARCGMELYLQRSYRDREGNGASGDRRRPVRRTIADFGIDRAAVDRAFAPYIERFFAAGRAPASAGD